MIIKADDGISGMADNEIREWKSGPCTDFMPLQMED
jgi:hypothetical protein